MELSEVPLPTHFPSERKTIQGHIPTPGIFFCKKAEEGITKQKWDTGEIT